MNDNRLRITEIKLKIAKLLERVQSLEKEVRGLKEERIQLLEELHNQKNSVQALEETNKMLKIAETLGQQSDVVEMRKQLNLYIREIDECLRLLSKP